MSFVTRGTPHELWPRFAEWLGPCFRAVWGDVDLDTWGWLTPPNPVAPDHVHVRLVSLNEPERGIDILVRHFPDKEYVWRVVGGAVEVEKIGGPDS